MNYVREKTDTLLQILKELPNQKRRTMPDVMRAIGGSLVASIPSQYDTLPLVPRHVRGGSRRNKGLPSLSIEAARSISARFEATGRASTAPSSSSGMELHR